MKKNRLILMLVLMSLSVSACGMEDRENRGRFDPEDDTVLTQEDDDPEDTAADTEASNRKILAGAIGIDENDGSMKYTLEKLKKIDAGRIQSAVKGMSEDGEEYIDIVAEDGTNFRMYLMGGYSVMDVENLDTGEWVIMNYR